MDHRPETQRGAVTDEQTLSENRLRSESLRVLRRLNKNNAWVVAHLLGPNRSVAICDATGLAAVADDTGLEVIALDGAPGVHSARWAGDDCSYADNRDKLLRELSGQADRRAVFRTCVLVRWPDGRELAVEGECPGTIGEQPAGERGFGYDAVFVPDEGDGRSFAEMTDLEKHALSHRGRAFRNLLAALSAET